MRIKKRTKFKAHKGELVEIKPAVKAFEGMAAAAAAAKAADELGGTLKLYGHLFEPEAVGVQANAAGDGGLILVPIGASLRSVYSTCKGLWQSEAMMRVEWPWEFESTYVKRYRKASYYTEHRDGRSFSVRRFDAKPAEKVAAAKWVRDSAALREGWEIERVA